MKASIIKIGNSHSVRIPKPIIAPMITKGRNYPTRVQCSFQDKKGQVVLDQIQTIDKKRLVKNLGAINSRAQNSVLNTLQELFAR